MIGYVINLSGAIKLQKYCYKLRAGIDEQIRQYWRYGLRFYQIDPPMGWQTSVESFTGSPRDMRAKQVSKQQTARAKLSRLYRKIRFAMHHRMHKPKRKRTAG